MPTQTNSLPQITLRRPLVCIGVAVAALNYTTEKVHALIQDGRLRFVWDLAVRSGQKRLIRILARSVVEAQSGRPAPQISESDEFTNVLATIFPILSVAPNGLDTISVDNLARRLSVDSEHIQHLADAGLLRMKKGSVPRRGPGGSAQILFPSVIKFLERRLLT